ncbi:hypothetical protein [Novosphingobium sp. AP12]|uniref:hypothetical protein n=1 Tax=Novosphingobium sp. AP12 TaxID=1144305 RepID=UPI0002720B59|nr:hypothetical protein [Novosphingobium sp. AP12]EJL20974.1 hypothetical protein PMI02_05298 [Novosphingobium sp. AP12]
MVDILALSLSHGLLLLAAWRLLSRPELDMEVRGEPAETPAATPPPIRGGRRVMRTGREPSPEPGSESGADA